tara:strand:+ start:13309 stop:14148 length:840 start_codon:yes stop_codon:yes gene_type:complete
MARPVSYVKYATLNDGISGDFDRMIQDACFKNCLFVFNDNFNQRNDLRPGAGNACIRPFKKSFQSIGIPTGWSIEQGGFHKLGNEEREAIDLGIERIRLLNNRFHYIHIFYSADSRGKLGNGVFNVAENVLSYITICLQEINKYKATKSWNEIIQQENELAHRCCSCSSFPFMFPRPSHSTLSKAIKKKPVMQKKNQSTFKKIQLPVHQAKIVPYFRNNIIFHSALGEPGHSVVLDEAITSDDPNKVRNTVDGQQIENLPSEKLNNKDEDIEYLLSFVE